LPWPSGHAGRRAMYDVVVLCHRQVPHAFEDFGAWRPRLRGRPPRWSALWLLGDGASSEAISARASHPGRSYSRLPVVVFFSPTIPSGRSRQTKTIENKDNKSRGRAYQSFPRQTIRGQGPIYEFRGVRRVDGNGTTGSSQPLFATVTRRSGRARTPTGRAKGRRWSSADLSSSRAHSPVSSGPNIRVACRDEKRHRRTERKKISPRDMLNQGAITPTKEPHKKTPPLPHHLILRLLPLVTKSFH